MERLPSLATDDELTAIGKTVDAAKEEVTTLAEERDLENQLASGCEVLSRPLPD